MGLVSEISTLGSSLEYNPALNSRVRQSVTPDRRPQSGVGRRLCLGAVDFFLKIYEKGLHQISPKLGMFLTDRSHYPS